MLYINDKRGDKSSNMSNSLSDCCNPCNTVPPVQIPGAQGPQGPAGAAGSDGTDAFSIVQSPGFTIPTVGNDVLVPVNQTQWMTTNAIVIASTGFGGPVTGPANFRIISINSATTVTLRALAYPGDAVNPATIATGALIAAAGLQGPTGTAGATFPTTTKGDTMFDDGANAPNPHVIRLGIGQQGQSLYGDPSNGTPGNVISWKGSVWALNTTVITIATGADLTEDTLMTYSIPGNTLRNAGDSIEFDALFSVLGTGTVATKTIRIYFGGSVIMQFGNAALDGGSLIFKGRIIRTTGASSIAYSSYQTTDSGGASTTKIAQSSPGETLSGAVLFKCTGQNGTNGVASGITQQALTVSYRANV